MIKVVTTGYKFCKTTARQYFCGSGRIANKSKFQYRRANRNMVQHSQEKSLQKPLHDTWLKILIQTQNGDIGNPKN